MLEKVGKLDYNQSKKSQKLAKLSTKLAFSWVSNIKIQYGLLSFDTHLETNW